MARVYVRDELSQWRPATLLSVEKDRVCIRLDPSMECGTKPSSLLDGTAAPNEKHVDKWLDLRDFQANSLPRGHFDADCGDVAHLDEVNEAEILHYLTRRFTEGKAYTRCGDQLLVLHPATRPASLYNHETKAKYFHRAVSGLHIRLEEKKDAEIDEDRLEPHIYEVSAKAYRLLVHEGRDQAIILLGEASSGKSSNAAHLVEHLVSKSKEPMLTRQILHAATIFDAFGAAQTRLNPNSTRSAKVTSLEFDQVNWSLVGASFRHFMLESTRVVARSASERNYNVFYQLLAAPASVKADVLGPDWAGATAHDFAYLAASTMPKSEFDGVWKKTSQALVLFGWEGTSLQHLMQATAIVLLLGNVKFLEHDDSASIQSRSDLNMLAISLGAEIEDLEEALTERQITTADGIHKTNQTQADDAKELCDSVAKAVYECLFASVSRQINILTAAPPLSSGKPKVLCVVDMFGFVNQEKNGLDQLLVNFANERMQLKYVVECFRAKRNLLRDRNCKLPLLDVLDNSETIALFEGSEGILRRVIEHCKTDGDSASQRQAHRSQDEQDAQITDGTSKSTVSAYFKENSFAIQHFVEKVTYRRSLFGSDRSPKKIPGRLLRLLSRSKNPILSQEFSRLLSGHEHAVKRVMKRRSRTEMFHRDLRDLLVQIRSSTLHFVRCIKMHGESSSIPEASLVLKQIQYAGLHPAAISIGELVRLSSRFQETEKIEAAFVLTRWAMPIVARVMLRNNISAASTKLSTWFRCRQARRRYETQIMAACIIARWIRVHLTEKRLALGSNVISLPLSQDDSTQSSCRKVRTHDSTMDTLVQHSNVDDEAIQQANADEEANSWKLLVEELQQNIMHAQMHNESMEAEYEERLADYEQEVLVLRQQLAVCEGEKAALRAEVVSSEANVHNLKDEIRGIQESHKSYLEKVLRAVDKANAGHTKSIEAIKRSRDFHLARLEAEIESLRQRQKMIDLSPSQKTEKITRLARKLEKVMSPIFILDQLSDASSSPVQVDTIEERISSKARGILYRLEDLCAISQDNCASHDNKAQLLDMHRRLECAYEEIDLLSSAIDNSSSRMVNAPADSPKKRRGVRKIVSKSLDV